MKKKLIWVGDACVATGFARATHHTLDVLKETWDVTVLGINYRGDPHQYPYPVYACDFMHDPIGHRRLAKLAAQIQPDLIILQNDVWHIPAYIEELQKAQIKTPVVGSLAVDGKNCQGTKLDGLSLAIFWTKFAEREAQLGGYRGPSAVVPLGVDLNIYKLANLDHIQPLREYARSLFHQTPGSVIDIEAFRKGFVVGNVNRNQGRKRWDLMVEYFAEWVKSKNIPDAFLLVQACPTGEQCYDIEQLMDYHGLLDRLFLHYPDIGQGIPEEQLPWTYRAFDVQLSTTQGEGFGLTTFEGMACGIPQIVPDWSALGELCEDAALKIPCTSTAVTPNQINVIGGVPDKAKTIEALDHLYRSKEMRQVLAKRGWELVRNPRYRWENVGIAFRDAINGLQTDGQRPTEERVQEDRVEHAV